LHDGERRWIVLAIAAHAFLCAFPAYFGTNGVAAYAAVTSIATIATIGRAPRAGARDVNSPDSIYPGEPVRAGSRFKEASC
jgi:hypothetical protein